MPLPDSGIGSDAIDPARYGLIASAVAGRAVEVAAGKPGEAAWSDGHTITVDPGLDHGALIESVVVQAALIGAGSLSADLLRPLLRKRRIRARYLAVEGPRAVAEVGHLLPRSLRHLVVDAPPARSPAESLERARSRSPIPEPVYALGELRPREVLALARRNESATVTDESGGTGSTPDGGAGGRTPPQQPGNDIPETAEVLLDAPGSSFGGRLLRKLIRGSARVSADGPIGGNTTSRGGAPNPAVRRLSTSPDTATAGTAGADDGRDGLRLRYPEWDARLGRYRPNWCSVCEIAPAEVHGTGSAAADLGLKWPLSRLGSGIDTRHRQRHGDDIDIDAAVESRVETMAGTDPGDAFYLATVRDRRDLSALILLDISGSAAELGAGRVPVHEHQRAAVAALATTMHRLGDRVAVYTYSSQGRRDVRIHACKTFDERSDLPMLGRLESLTPSGYSRLGAAIRHGAAIIDAHAGTTRRLLIVVSDGLAFDHGYDLGYGAQDVRRALSEVRARGTGCLCLAVGATAGATDLREVFGTAAHAAVPRADHLAPVITRLFRSALKSAEYQKGSSTR